ncbi:NAD-dependent epimerase/dehydratase family protein [Streptomyces paradoxus]|uniref:NAD-dependent epimerase/dehydratase family protein n=1 Tax=Streptomyces paradoxus TaxID=66375 RepID=UPI0036FB5E09
MCILVLGFNGYLGRHITEHLRAALPNTLLTAGRSPTADVRVDLASDHPGRLAEALASAAPDAVVNCAGLTGGDAMAQAEVNARGPATLCAALRQAAPRARLVHLGSAAEYGPGVPGTRMTESAATCPAGPYGATKLAGTAAVTTSGLDAVVLRVGNPVGPGAPLTSLPGRVAAMLRETGPDRRAVLWLGDLSAFRDFVDVRDVARAALLAVMANRPLPSVLNISGGEAVPVRELVRKLALEAGFPGLIEEDGEGSARSSHVSWQCSSIAAAVDTLGWRPSHTLDESLAALWAATGPADEAGHARHGAAARRTS